MLSWQGPSRVALSGRARVALSGLARVALSADFADFADCAEPPRTNLNCMLHQQTTNVILGAFFEIYRARGYGFLETVYSNSLAVELGTRGLCVKREVPIRVFWKEVPVGTYRMDLLVDDSVLVEVKSVEMLTDAHNRQLINYLKATGLEVGLLLNFGPDPRFVRRVNSKSPVTQSPRRVRDVREVRG